MQNKILAATCLSLLAANAAAFDKNDAVGVAAGIVQGITHNDDLSMMKECITNADSIESQIMTLVADLKEGNMEGVKKAISEFGHMAKQLPADLKNCKGMEADIIQLEQLALVFTHPIELAARLEANMLRHYSELIDDVSHGLRKWDAKDYHGFGEDIGDAVLVALSPPEKHVVLSIRPNDTPDVVAGLLNGIIHKDDSSQIRNCLGNT